MALLNFRIYTQKVVLLIDLAVTIIIVINLRSNGIKCIIDQDRMIQFHFIFISCKMYVKYIVLQQRYITIRKA